MKKLANIALFAVLGFAATAQSDNIYTQELLKEKQPLAYDYIHEKDVFWEKKVWREIDTKVKRNQHFTYPLAPLADILLDAAKAGKIKAYSSQSDDFSLALSPQEVIDICSETDTIIWCFADTWSSDIQVVRNDLDVRDLQKYRLKEVWYMDEAEGKLKARILGIAPIINRYDYNGNFLHAAPLCWFYYPELRPFLAQKEAFNTENDANKLTWEEVFETRLFDSQITKISGGTDRCGCGSLYDAAQPLVAEKITDALFDIEQALWEY